MADEHNSKAVTQDDVARRAGVSRSNVSYVINNGPRKVSDETRQRVLEAIKDLGYRPNKHAQMLSATEETFADKYIGIILAANYMFKRPYYGSILASLHEYAHEKDWHIRFIRVFDDFSNPALFNELIHPDEIRGLVMVGLDQVPQTSERRALIAQIVQRVERVVCVEWEWPGVPSIQFDRQNAAYQATQHLLALGRKRVAYVGVDDKRVQGYQQALWESGIGLDSQLIRFALDSKAGYEACEDLLRLDPGIDAISSGTDEVALGILSCLQQYRVAIPQTVAIASIDNLEFAAFTSPPLTTVDVPKHDIGVHAIETLISNSSREKQGFAITVPTRLIVRASSSQA
jgi:LacI family transcriptional regulator